MTLQLQRRQLRGRFGLKGPRAAQWLASHGIIVPESPNTWAYSPAAGHEVGFSKEARGHDAVRMSDEAHGGDAVRMSDEALFVARLGIGEFFLEDLAGGTWLRSLEPAAHAHPPGVYPVLREDAAYSLSGEGAADVLAQVCNIDFAAYKLNSQPIIMTLMIGVAVLVAPQPSGTGRRYWIWCDPSFGPCLEESLIAVVRDGGGSFAIAPRLFPPQDVYHPRNSSGMSVKHSSVVPSVKRTAPK
ncbi:MAG: hypothetical protein M3N97_15825 [Pseudomonadota bacterium]|nr:hypothetical protein [Pseudomonadota bacterium]